jgi:D-amino-acid oxidase
MRSTAGRTCGVSAIKLTEYRAIAPKPLTPWWASLSPSFKHIQKEALPPGVATGMSMDAFVAYPGVYLKYLLDRAVERGARTYRTSLPTDGGLDGVVTAAKEVCIRDSGRGVLAVVNATGLLARDICPQDSLVPVRGQTLLVKGESKELRTMIGEKPGEVLAVIPRVGTGTTIVGSTRGPGRWDLEPDEKDTKWLIKEAELMAPELFESGKLEIMKVNVGLRPSRKGGARVELENVGRDMVVHQYGHDGAG